MAPFLDSADLDNITYVEVMVVIRGIAMNPTLPRSHTNDPLKHLCAVLDASAGEVMYQPTKVDQDALDEALHELDRERVVPHPLRRPRGTRPPQQSTPRGRDGPRAAQPGDDRGDLGQAPPHRLSRHD
jgi:hypothetical protein